MSKQKFVNLYDKHNKNLCEAISILAGLSLNQLSTNRTVVGISGDIKKLLEDIRLDLYKTELTFSQIKTDLDNLVDVINENIESFQKNKNFRSQFPRKGFHILVPEKIRKDLPILVADKALTFNAVPSYYLTGEPMTPFTITKEDLDAWLLTLSKEDEE